MTLTSPLFKKVRVFPSPTWEDKGICPGLEYKPCLESGNALEGTSRNVLSCASLILPKGKGLLNSHA